MVVDFIYQRNYWISRDGDIVTEEKINTVFKKGEIVQGQKASTWIDDIAENNIVVHVQGQKDRTVMPFGKIHIDVLKVIESVILIQNINRNNVVVIVKGLCLEKVQDWTVVIDIIVGYLDLGIYDNVMDIGSINVVQDYNGMFEVERDNLPV